MKALDIIWDNTSPIEISIYDTPPANHIYKIFKHLQHLPLDFSLNIRDNPFSRYRTDSAFTYTEIVRCGSIVGIDVDINELTDQLYLNHLHKLYELGYDGRREWLIYHELIHIIERLNRNVLPESINIDYREQAGLLTTDFDRSYNKYSTNNLYRGVVYIRWQELGKSPYEYFIDGEPHDITRMCQLAKPWIYLKPNLYIAYYDSVRKDGQHVHSADFRNRYTEFLTWFKEYEDEWKAHWNVPDWTPDEMFKVIPIGFISDMDVFQDRLTNLNYPTNVVYA